jgi:hypothetical protein
VSPFAIWLDAAVGPPWSGLALLATMGALSGAAVYVSIKVLDRIARGKP